MPHLNVRLWKHASVAIAIAIASVVLAACGGSSNSSTSSSASSSTAANARPAARTLSTTNPPPAGASRPCWRRGSSRSLRRRARMHEQAGRGAADPQSGATTWAGGLRSRRLAEGSDAPALRSGAAAGAGGSFPRGRLPGLRNRYGTAAGKKALAKFASCMRENGVNIPAPNTSGNGPVFKTNALHVSSAAFRKAYAKCSSDLLGEQARN